MENNENDHENYDSTVDTLLHIKRVSELLNLAATELIRRANCHDQSKLDNPEEKEHYDRLTPILKELTYGSEEYNKSLEELQPALQAHYKNPKNTHHPQHYKNGVDDMDLFDIVEMFFDWKASSERQADGNIHKSIELNKGRFKIAPQIIKILENTAKKFNW